MKTGGRAVEGAETAAGSIAAPGGALIWCPFPDRDSAETAANRLLDECLIACANIVPAMVSLFAWNGERSTAQETGVLFKTDPTLLAAAMARIEALHPYDQPAILGWPCAATAATGQWLAGECSGPHDAGQSEGMPPR